MFVISFPFESITVYFILVSYPEPSAFTFLDTVTVIVPSNSQYSSGALVSFITYTSSVKWSASTGTFFAITNLPVISSSFFTPFVVTSNFAVEFNCTPSLSCFTKTRLYFPSVLTFIFSISWSSSPSIHLSGVESTSSIGFPFSSLSSAISALFTNILSEVASSLTLHSTCASI